MVPRLAGGDQGPKLLTLVALRSACPEELDADLHRFHGGTYRQLRVELTARELAAVAASLPAIQGSAVRRFLAPEGHDWGHAEELLAGVFDRLGELIWQNVGDQNRPHPEPYPKPNRDDDSDSLTPTESFDTPEAWDAWRASLYDQQPE